MICIELCNAEICKPILFSSSHIMFMIYIFTYYFCFFQMSSPFLSPQFKAWSEQVAKEGSRLACVVKLRSGDIVTYGDYEWGLKTFSEQITVKKHNSGDWVPNQETDT